MISGIATALLMALFLGVWLWAWSKRRTADFDEAAHLPLVERAPQPREKPQA